jgi:hypothetical protein
MIHCTLAGVSLCIYMFLFSTIVYFSESLVGYEVYCEENTFQLKPAIDNKVDFEPPILTATYSE